MKQVFTISNLFTVFAFVFGFSLFAIPAYFEITYGQKFWTTCYAFSIYILITRIQIREPNELTSLISTLKSFFSWNIELLRFVLPLPIGFAIGSFVFSEILAYRDEIPNAMSYGFYPLIFMYVILNFWFIIEAVFAQFFHHHK